MDLSPAGTSGTKFREVEECSANASDGHPADVTLNTEDELVVHNVLTALLAKVCDSESKQLSGPEPRAYQGALEMTEVQDLDSDRSSTIAAILAKLNDPQQKLNRRERRALQRELEMAQGIQKIYPTSQPYPHQSSTASDCLSHCLLEGNERVRSTQSSQSPVNAVHKRPPSSSIGNNVAANKVARTQEPVSVVRESVFKLDTLSTTAHNCAVTIFNCGRISYISSAIPINNFLKLCRFSPSGSYIGTTSADNWARIFGLDDDRKLSLVAKIPLGDAAYDIKWLMSGGEKQFLATTAKHHPIHLWTEQGMRYSSYRGINHLDELTAAYSITFSNDGTRLYGGYNSCIRIWNTNHPGRQHTTIKTWEKQTGGQKSIISCIAMNKVFDGVYAAGSYDGNVGFYSDRTNSLECMFSTDSAGITDMHYSYDGQRLFIATRKRKAISCYDMRMPGNLLFSLLRPFTTNQRACFEMDSFGHYLFSGTSEGDLVVFDLSSDTAEKPPVFSRRVAECSVPCVSIHEGKPPMVALCTGERVFPSPCIGRSSSSDSDSNDDETSYRRRGFDKKLNNSLQLWCF